MGLDPQCRFVVGTLQSSLISGLNSLTQFLKLTYCERELDNRPDFLHSC